MTRGYEEADKLSTGKLVLHKPVDHAKLKEEALKKKQQQVDDSL